MDCEVAPVDQTLPVALLEVSVTEPPVQIFWLPAGVMAAVTDWVIVNNILLTSVFMVAVASVTLTRQELEVRFGTTQVKVFRAVL